MKLRQLLKDHFLPHEGNDHHPHYFRTATVTALLIGVLVLEGAYFAQTKYVFKETDFLASVLPGVLASLTNQDRADYNLPPLEEDADLARAAQLKADDMAEKGYFAHVSPDGKQPWNWLKQAGYDYSYAGENLAVNFTDSTQVEEAWMNSPTHKANIIKKEYTKVGFGIAKGTYEGKEAVFVVQFFATPPAKAAAAPIAAEPAPEPAPVAAVTTEPVQTDPSSVPVPAEEEVTEPIPAQEDIAIEPVVPADTQVLGTETQTVSFNPITWIETVATSPIETSEYILAAVLILTFFALLLSILVKMHVQHPAVIMAGALLITVYLGAIYLNNQASVALEVPSSDQSAGALNAFGAP